MQSYKILVIIAAIAAAAKAQSDQHFRIESPPKTTWGDWGPTEFCNPGEAVYGFRIKSHEKQGLFSDDTSMNGLELFCYPVSKKRHTAANSGRSEMEIASTILTSTEGHKGAWQSSLTCLDGQWIHGFQLRSESNQGFQEDDSGANNVRVFCSGGATLEAQGNSFGEWTEPQACLKSQYVCGLQTQVEKAGATDETSLNNIRMYCCDF